MMPVQPHTSGRQARTCESCHSDPKALGYGIEGGRFLRGYTEERTIDLKDADGKVLAAQSQPQLAAIPDLPMDWSQIVDPTTGEQLMTVGTSWPDDGPLRADQRTRVERTGLCMGCHQNMGDSAFWTEQVIAKFGQAISNDEHIQVMNAVIQAAVAAPSAQAAPALTTGTALTESVPVTTSGAVTESSEVTDEITATVPVTTSSAVTTTGLVTETPVAVAESRTEEAEVRIIDAESRAAAAVARTSAVEARLATSVTQATALQDKLTAAEAALTQAQTAEQSSTPATSGMTLWVLVALALGVVAGSGAIYFTGRRSP